MRILTMAGTVPANSNLPTFDEVFPALIAPNLVKYQDGFSTHTAGSIAGKTLPYATAGAQTWTSSAQSDCVPDADGGYISPTGTSDRFHTITNAANGVTMGRFVWGASVSGAIGLVFRFTDTSNTMRVAITPTTVAIQSRTSGSTTTVTSTGFVPVVGQEYSLKVTYDDDDLISLYIDGVLYLSATSANHNTATKTGVYFTGLTTHKCLEFACG